MIASIRSRCLLALLLLMALPTAAQQGSAPYSSLYRALEPGLQLARYPRLAAVQRITSKLGSVDPATIEVSIASRAGTHRIQVGADGRVQFPMDAALLAEDPPVLSNQPRGSLSVSVSFEILPPAGTQLEYREFNAAVGEAHSALRDLGGPYAAAGVVGVEFRMAEDGASATIESPDSEELFLADGKRRIVLQLDPRLPLEGTRIRFSSPPVQAFPHLRMQR